MNYLAFIILIPFAAILPFYLKAEKQEKFRTATTLKVILSGLCACCALLGFLLLSGSLSFPGFPSLPGDLSLPGNSSSPGFLPGESPLYARAFVFVALACAVVGDYFMQFTRLDEKKFGVGIVFFALTQVFLIISLLIRHGIAWPEFAMTAAIFFFVLLLMKAQRWQAGRALAPLSVYIALVIFMTSKAALPLAACIKAGDNSIIIVPLFFMAAGATLVLVSDLLLGISLFKPGSKIGVGVKLTTYFCGLMLIALSNSFY